VDKGLEGQLVDDARHALGDVEDGRDGGVAEEYHLARPRVGTRLFALRAAADLLAGELVGQEDFGSAGGANGGGEILSRVDAGELGRLEERVEGGGGLGAATSL